MPLVSLAPKQVINAQVRLGCMTADIRYAEEDLSIDLDNVDRFLASVVVEAENMRRWLATVRKEA